MRDLSEYISSWQARNQRLGSRDQVVIDGLAVAVHPGVFSPDPRLTFSTTMLLRSLPALAGKTLLDVGTGCGIVALHGARQGALRVTACDIQPEAIANTQENAMRAKLSHKIEIVESDVFENVKGTYDVIAANLPFMVKTYAMNHIASETYRRFFAGLTQHLAPAGCVHLTFGSWGDLETLNEMIEASNLQSDHLIEKRGDASWYIFKLSAAPGES